MKMSVLFIPSAVGFRKRKGDWKNEENKTKTCCLEQYFSIDWSIWTDYSPGGAC